MVPLSGLNPRLFTVPTINVAFQNVPLVFMYMYVISRISYFEFKLVIGSILHQKILVAYFIRRYCVALLSDLILMPDASVNAPPNPRIV